MLITAAVFNCSWEHVYYFKRFLIKDEYIHSVIGSFGANVKKNVASIVKNIFIDNDKNIVDWLAETVVIVANMPEIRWTISCYMFERPIIWMDGNNFHAKKPTSLVLFAGFDGISTMICSRLLCHSYV